MRFEPAKRQVFTPENRITLTGDLIVSVGIATAVAIVYWLIALRLGDSGSFLVWNDQEVIFLRGVEFVRNPYDVPAFFNPPWAMVTLLPFSAMPDFRLGVLGQLIVFGVLLTLLVYKFNGSGLSLFAVLSSPIAFESALELNLEWIVCMGLLVPPRFSMPLVLVKPQVAPGYFLAFTPRQLLEAGGVFAVVLLLSIGVWGFWWEALFQTAANFRLALQINVAPMHLLSVYVSIPVGMILAIYAFRNRDATIGILAGMFFVPYFASYSLIIPLALLAVRWPYAVLIVNTAIWVILTLFVVSA